MAALPYNPLDLDDLFSPYSRFFGTNYTPQGKDESTLRQIISKAETELLHLDRLASWIESRRETIKLSSAECSAMMSPIRRVSDDVLREIMIQYVASNWMGASSPAWTLAHVCRRWRHVAESTPRIWSYISVGIGFFEDEGPDTTNRCHIIRQMISRSKSTSLSVEAHVRGSRFTGKPWSIIMKSSTRIVFLRVLSRADAYRPPCDAFPGPFPLLQSLELYDVDIGAASSIFRECRGLKQLRLSNVAAGWSKCRILELPWAQLTSIAIQYSMGDFSQIMVILKEASSLEELIISVSGSVGTYNGGQQLQDGAITSLPKLKRLSLRVHELMPGKWLIQSLMLPALKELAMDVQLDHIDAYGQFYALVSSCIKSSKSSITKFSLIDDGFGNCLLQLLQSMPDLEYFKYYASPHPGWTWKIRPVDAILEEFIPNPQFRNIKNRFHRLKELVIMGAPLEENKSTVARFLHHRKSTLELLCLRLSNSTMSINLSDITGLMDPGNHQIYIDIRFKMEHVFTMNRNQRTLRQHRPLPSESFSWAEIRGDW